MADNVHDVTLEILKGIQASVADVRTTIDELRADMVGHFEKVEGGLRKERRSNAGTLFMMRATAGRARIAGPETQRASGRVARAA